MTIFCFDLEGVLVPEVWLKLAKSTGIKELKRTTRDEPVYDRLMRQRLDILDQHGLTIHDIRSIVNTMAPLEGAVDFLAEVRMLGQPVIVSDTFVEFGMPLIEALGSPLVLCNSLQLDKKGRILSHMLRQPEGKKRTVEAFQSLNYRVVAAGDSYNDIAMLMAADLAALFRCPPAIKKEFPDLPALTEYGELLDFFRTYLPTERKTSAGA